MKKRTWSVVLCLAYIAALSGLLLVHIRRIAGETERIMAILELLLLLLFVVVLLWLYIKEKEKGAPQKEEQTTSGKGYAENQEQFMKLISNEGLSEREKEVAWLIWRGFTNRQIAEELFIAETTVKKHVTHIYEKCNVSGRKEWKERWRKEK